MKGQLVDALLKIALADSNVHEKVGSEMAQATPEKPSK